MITKEMQASITALQERRSNAITSYIKYDQYFVFEFRHFGAMVKESLKEGERLVFLRYEKIFSNPIK